VTVYIEFRDNLENNKTARNTIIPIEELPSRVDPYTDAYRSLFFYDKDILEYVAKNGSVSGFRGKAGIERLVWDFDSTDLDIARKDALALISKLKTQYQVKDNEIGIFFSGRKGFAIEVKCDGIVGIDKVLHENVPIYIKRLCIKIANELESFDRVIYNHNRLYRINGTLHQKESELEGANLRLFKTSISLSMLQNSTLDDIKKYAIELRIPEEFTTLTNPTKFSEEIQYIIAHIDEISRDIQPNAVIVDEKNLPDEKLAPNRSKICIWRLCQGHYTSQRDNALLLIADYEKKAGMPAEAIRGKLKGIVELMNRNDPVKAKLDPIIDSDLDRLVRQVMNNNYDAGCYNPILDSQCSRKCYLAHAKFDDLNTNTITLLDAYKQSRSFYRKYYENIVPTGFNTLDNNMPLFLSTLNIICGKSGTGKTSFMLNIMKHASAMNIPALFFSLDMSQEMLISRCAPILLANKEGTNLISAKSFMESHARNNTDLMDRALQEFEKISTNVLISSQRSMTVKQINDEVEKQEQIWGRKIKLVIIDYVQLLASDKEGFANHEFNASALTELAKNRGVCVIGLSQATGDYNTGAILAKGSRAWEEGTSTQINCFRPFQIEQPAYDFIMSVRMAKNRLGATDTIDLFFDGASGFMRDLTESELLEVSALRDRVDHEDN
jgi:hypothetical protein